MGKGRMGIRRGGGVGLWVGDRWLGERVGGGLERHRPRGWTRL